MKQQANTTYRHGDVILIAIDQLPANVTPVKRDNRRVILAYGEVTGHAHALSVDETVVTLFEASGEEDRFLQVNASCDLIARGTCNDPTSAWHLPGTKPAGVFPGRN